MSDTPTRNAERYGGPIVSPRAARILAVVVGAVFLAGVVVVGLWSADSPVKATLITYEHVDDSTMEVSFQVTMRPGTEASCTVQALNEGRAQIGFVEVPIPAQTERQSVHRATISTQGDSVSAEVVGCQEH